MKKRKLQLLITVMLIFILSAQTVLAADGARLLTTVSKGTESVSGNGEDISGNELQEEVGYFFYQGETNIRTTFDLLSYVLTDTNGNSVATWGEAKKVKIILWGNLTNDAYILDTETIHYLEQELGGSSRVEIIAGDTHAPNAGSLQIAAACSNFRFAHICVEKDFFERALDVLAVALYAPDEFRYYSPAIYVVDSDNIIRYVSIGYGKDELAPLVNYVRGMDDYTGRGEVRAFVRRLYSFVLNREPDAGGLNDWVEKLMSKQITGNDAAVGFFFSKELEMRNVSDSEFVELLYKVMMNRDSDPSGKAYWMNMLNNGVSRRGVFNGFAGSAEFDNICNSYGINRGTTTALEGRDKNYGATLFVARLYTQALGRSYDVDGLNDWCNRIVSGGWSVTDVSTTGFFESPEFRNKNLNNEEYVKVLYRTFLGREYDAAGLADWVGKLNSGAMDRTQVLKGFSNSPEFANIMREYGL